MSSSLSSNVTSKQRGAVRAIIIAAAAAFALGLLGAFISKTIAAGHNPPMASSGSDRSTM